MKKLLGLLPALIICLSLQAQDRPEDILRLINEGKLVSFEYSLAIGDEVSVLYSGTASVQAGAFIIKGNGVEIYCDGESLTVVDPKAKEIYIEKACSIQDYISSNIGKIKDAKFSKLNVSSRQNDISFFKFDLKSKDSSWIITDIRQ